MRFLPTAISIFAAALMVGPAEAQTGNGYSHAEAAGRVGGQVLDLQGAPVAGVEVRVDGTELATASGIDGRFVLAGVPAGVISLQFRRIGYRAKTVAGVRVPAGGAVAQDVTLEPQVFQLDEVVVVSAAAERGSVSRVLEEQRTALNIISGVSIAQIERSPDSDAGQAAQRVSGVTVQEGKYVFVRGLGERYTTTSLNGSRVPSPEPERRVVPLDLFPAGLLDAITTSKTFTPDQPGDFSGAQVNLRTREFPLRRTASLSVGLGLNDAVTGRTLWLPPTVGREWLGFAGDERAMPAVARDAGDLRGATQSDLNAIIGSFRNAWSASPATGAPSRSLSASIGGEDPVLGVPLGYVGSLTYSYGPEARLDERRALAVAGDAGTRAQNEYRGSSARTAVLWGGLFNLSARLGTTSKLALTNLYDRSAENEAVRLAGANEEFGVDLDLTRLTFTERSMRSHQLEGQHLIAGRHQLDWSGTLAGVTRHEPDRSDLVYLAERDALTGEIAPTRWFGAPRSAVRTFSELSEDSHDARSSLRLAFGSPSHAVAVKLGGAYRRVTREADSRAFDIVNYTLNDTERSLAPEEIFSGSHAQAGRLGLFINANGGRYRATDQNVAGFLQVELPVGGAVRVIGGARVERARLHVESRSPQGVPTQARLDHTDVLPSLSVNVQLNPRQNLRLSASQTLSRPEYRELSLVSYFEVLGGSIVFGNPDLTRSLIRNVDLRWEWFPNPGEVISVGAFAKRFIDPIERVIVGTTGASALSFVNAEGAYNYGVELDLRSSLYVLIPALAPFTVFGNATLMHSSIRPGNEGVSALTSADRPMVGQAGYVLNAGLGYAHPTRNVSATVLYNVVGRRIAEAGVLPLPDSYEQPRHVLDLALRVPLGSGVALKLDAKNLLDAEYRITQGDVVRHTYRSGRGFSSLEVHAMVTWGAAFFRRSSAVAG